MDLRCRSSRATCNWFRYGCSSGTTLGTNCSALSPTYRLISKDYTDSMTLPRPELIAISAVDPLKKYCLLALIGFFISCALPMRMPSISNRLGSSLRFSSSCSAGSFATIIPNNHPEVIFSASSFYADRLCLLSTNVPFFPFASFKKNRR